MPSPRYPDLEIELPSANPLARVARVRHELRRAGVPRVDIRDFTDQALSTGVDREVIDEVIREWVDVKGRDAGASA